MGENLKNKHGLHFEPMVVYGKDKSETMYLWQIWDNGTFVAGSNHFHPSIKEAEKNIRTINQILNPSTVKNKAITDAITAFKKKK